jgi:protease IV
MSSAGNSGQPLEVTPAYPAPRRPSFAGWIVRFIGTLVIVASFLLNIVLLVALIFAAGMRGEEANVREAHYSGTRNAADKVAIVRIDGIILEGTVGFVRKQIEQAAKDAAVKAVVLRINSPGGSVTASDNLHHRLIKLRDGEADKQRNPKPLVVSMGSLAASGGYYIAMPAKTLLAERTSMTGSIGVYAAFPNVAEMGNKIGFTMNIIKAGAVKDSGSPFQVMSDKERLLFQDTVDRMYLQFLRVVEDGRPRLKGKLQEDIAINETLPVRAEKSSTQQLKFNRYRADGGIFTAEEAKTYGLIDQIGYLDDAVKLASQAAGISGNYKAVSYEKPHSYLGALFDGQEDSIESTFDRGRLAEAAVPQFWYLAPQSELAGIFAVLKSK